MRFPTWFLCCLSLLLSFANCCTAYPKSGEGAYLRGLHKTNLTTNARRLAAGLPLLKPRQLFNPSRVKAREPASSPLPPLNLLGTVKVVRVSDPTNIGYVKRTTSGSVTYTKNDPLHVNINVPSDSTPFNIIHTDGPSSYPALGFDGPNLPTPDAETIGLRDMAFSKLTSPGSRPRYVGLSPRPEPGPGEPLPQLAQTAVWFYNRLTGELTAQFVDSAGGVFFPIEFLHINDGTQRILIAQSYSGVQYYYSVNTDQVPPELHPVRLFLEQTM